MNDYTNKSACEKEFSDRKSVAMGIASMILGILALPLCCCGYAHLIALVMVIISIVFSLVEKKKNGGFSAFSLVGFICGCVSGAFIVIIWITTFVGIFINLMGQI